MADVLPMTGVEVIYPVVPLHMVDVILNQQDSMLWRRLQLSANQVRDVLRFRVRDSNFDAFLSFLESHLLVLAELNIPGVYAFGKDFYRCDTRIIYYSGHLREMERFFRIDVTFEFKTGLA